MVYFKFSVQSHIAVVGFILSISMFLQVQSAPVQNNAVDMPWWHRPCSNQNYTQCEAGTTSIYQYRSRDLAIIITVIKNALIDVKNSLENSIYSTVLHQIPKKQLNIQWLPKRHWKTFKYEKKQNKEVNMNDWLHKFHEELQIFAATFDRLLSVTLDTEIIDSVSKHRHAILHTTIDELRQILCEVETIYNNSCPGKMPRIFNTPHHVRAKVSMTDIRTQDIAIVIKYRESLSDWLRILRSERKSIKLRHGKRRRLGMKRRKQLQRRYKLKHKKVERKRKEK